MKQIRLNLNSGQQVNIHINFDLLKDFDYIKEQIGSSKRLFIISQETVYNAYVKELEAYLSTHYDLKVFIVPDGETAKSLSQAEHILSEILTHGVERQDTLIGVGGGVVGDLSGFVASLCLRGIRLIQVPTTLLSQVDASIGGKTGVNHPTGKNLIGTFYQPKHILIDPSVLNSLDQRECKSGFAEVIKYGVIRNRDLFSVLSQNNETLKQFNFDDNKDLWLQVISASVQDKVNVVEKDEKEAGLRATLNFGHTIGHGIEALFGYNGYKHGECVAIGMAAATHIAEKKDLISEEEAQHIYTLIKAYDYHNLALKSFSLNDIMPYLMRDKKVKQKQLHFILPTSVGTVVSKNDVTETDIESSLAFILDFFKEN